MVELVRERQQILKHRGNRIYQMRWGYRKELEQVRAREADTEARSPVGLRDDSYLNR